MGADLQPPATLLCRTVEEWRELFVEWGQPAYRAGQVFAWIHKRGVVDPEQMTDLPASLRGRLSEAGLAEPLTLQGDHLSVDGTRKLVVAMGDGRRVETVLIPQASVSQRDLYAPPSDEDGELSGPLPAVTQCVSSQVGCAMGCTFCASGIAGLKRNMDAGEIVGQVLLARRLIEGQARLAGVVFMGMGEPLHNYGQVARALTLLSHPEGVGLSLRRVTLSTSGLVPQIDQLARDFQGRVRLAVSLHAARSDTRTRLMPINKKHPLDELIACLGRYPHGAHRRITVEYTLIRDVNDAPDDANALLACLSGLHVMVNLIPMNPVDGAGLEMPSSRTVRAFQEILRDAGLDTFVRRQRGDDIAAACGQLALKGEAPVVQMRAREQGKLA